MSWLDRILGREVAHSDASAVPNPMQQACDMARREPDGTVKLSTIYAFATEELGLSGAQAADLSHVRVDCLMLDAKGVAMCGEIQAEGFQCQSLISDPYSTYGSLKNNGAEPMKIGEAVFVGYADTTRVDCEPMKNAEIGRVTLIDAEGRPGHNIAVAFEGCRIGEVNAHDSKLVRFQAENCEIGSLNATGARGLQCHISGGAIRHIGTNDASIGPGSAILGCALGNQPQGFAGQLSLEGSVLPPQPQTSGAEKLEAALAEAYQVAAALRDTYGGDEIVAECHQTRQYAVDHPAMGHTVGA